MNDVFICDSVRTPIGRYGGGLAAVRADDLAALPLRVLVERNPGVNWSRVDDIVLGCANQAGEDNRNVARMSSLLAGLPIEVPGTTVNRLCGSGLNAVSIGANAIKSGEADLIIAGGVENMSRSPFVMGKSTKPYDRSSTLQDTTMGWRFINKKLDDLYGTEVMPQTAENLANEHGISREDQDQFALWSQTKAASATTRGQFAEEITPVTILRKGMDERVVSLDEHPRDTTLEQLAHLRSLFSGGSITAGNASGINDGAAALLLASEKAVLSYGLNPKARILGTAVAGVPPRTMGFGPVPATAKLLDRLGLTLDEIDILEFNEAFAAQVLTCTRALNIADDDPRINPQGGAIALGHPLGMSGARLAITATHQLQRTGARRALCTMCIGVGQGIATVIERV